MRINIFFDTVSSREDGSEREEVGYRDDPAANDVYFKTAFNLLVFYPVFTNKQIPNLSIFRCVVFL